VRQAPGLKLVQVVVAQFVVDGLEKHHRDSASEPVGSVPVIVPRLRHADSHFHSRLVARRAVRG
jgi:hypothetical protein